MGKRLLKCTECGTFTISTQRCPACMGKLESVYPAKFSLDDKYQKYRLPFFKKKMQELFDIEKETQEISSSKEELLDE